MVIVSPLSILVLCNFQQILPIFQSGSISHVLCNAVTVLLSVFISSFGANGNTAVFCILALNLKIDEVLTRYSHLEIFFGIFSMIVLTSANTDSHVCAASALTCRLPSTIVFFFNFDSIMDGL